MPGLVAFNRRWGIGSDDLAIPFFIESLFRLAWFGLVVGLLVTNYEVACHEGVVLTTYLIMLLVLLGMALLVNSFIICLSLKGTITLTRPRRHITKLLYLRLAIMLPEVILHAIGTYWSFAISTTGCVSSQMLIVIKVVVCLGWVFLLAVCASIFLVFDPTGKVRHSQVSDMDVSQPGALYVNLTDSETYQLHRKWEFRMKLLCCCATHEESSQNIYKDAANLFVKYFEDVDLVPSDIAAGLILLQQRQGHDLLLAPKTPPVSYHSETPDSFTSTGGIHGSVLSSPGVFSPPPAHQFWMTPEMSSHFMKFALGSYGWPQYLYSHCLSGLANLCSSCVICCKKPPSFVVDDNCCQWHSRSLKLLTGLTNDDLVYVSFHNRIFEVPFYVAVDHQTSCVVVCIRGTLSLKDAMTDLTAQCASLALDGCQISCHKGILLAAEFVQKRLEESRALDNALSLHPSYTLVITGHSLGAGTASILALLLRGKYPNLRCFCYGPPGGLLNYEAVRYTEEFIMTVVLGDDVVPRLSLTNMEDLKKKLLECLVECEQPKHQVLLEKLWSKCHPSQNSPSESVGSSTISRPLLSSTHSSKPKSYYTSQETHDHLSRPHLFPPGRILHVTNIDNRLRAKWVTLDYFNQIIISPRMLLDHLPYTMHQTLTELVECNSAVALP